MGWIGGGEMDDDVVRAAACYEQLDSRDMDVLLKGVYCDYKFGKGRGQVRREIGGRRHRLEYVEYLARVCQEGLRDIGHFNARGGVCWVGRGSDGTEKMWMKRGFEECHTRFGVDVRVDWEGDVSS